MLRLFLAAGLLFGWSAQAHALDMNEVIAAVQKNHPEIAKSQWLATAARFEKNARPWVEDPQFQLMLEDIATNRNGLADADMTKWRVSQEIPFPGTLVGRYQQAKYEQLEKLAEVKGTERAAVAIAKQTFFELYATDKMLALKKKIAADYSQLISLFEQKYASSGLTTPNTNKMADENAAMTAAPQAFDQMLMAKVRKEAITAEIHDLEHQELALKAKLNLLMGKDPQELISLLVEPATHALTKNQDELLALLEKNNSELAASQWRIKAQSKAAGLAKLSLVPTLEPEFEYNQREAMTNAYSVGASLNIPLWGPRNHAEIQSAKAMLAAEKKDRENLKLKLREELAYLVYHAIQHHKIIGIYKNKIIPLAQAAKASHTCPLPNQPARHHPRGGQSC